MEKSADILIREAAEKNISTLAKALQKELAVNDAQTNPNRRVHTALLVVREEDRFIALDGSAHRMGGLFRELFERRPDLVGVVREVMDGVFRVANR